MLFASVYLSVRCRDAVTRRLKLGKAHATNKDMPEQPKTYSKEYKLPPPPP